MRGCNHAVDELTGGVSVGTDGAISTYSGGRDRVFTPIACCALGVATFSRVLTSGTLGALGERASYVVVLTGRTVRASAL